MEMVGHQNELEQANMVLFDSLGQAIYKPFPILIIRKQPTAVKTTLPDHSTRHVVDRPGKLNS